MYTRYNIPQNGYNNSRNYQNSSNYSNYGTSYPTTYRDNSFYYNDGDRFIGGGLLGPLVLGGIGGYLIGRPNYPPGPIPVYIPPQPAPYYPPYSNTNIYY